jgi:hypothetical protein
MSVEFRFINEHNALFQHSIWGTAKKTVEIASNWIKIRAGTTPDTILQFRIVFWDVLPCKIIVDRRFRGTYFLHHQGWRQFWTSHSPPWKLEISQYYSIVAQRTWFWSMKLHSSWRDYSLWVRYEMFLPQLSSRHDGLCWESFCKSLSHYTE